ncbi:hypothetical protein Tco_0594025 [Tanacetum coccineum]
MGYIGFVLRLSLMFVDVVNSVHDTELLIRSPKETAYPVTVNEEAASLVDEEAASLVDEEAASSVDEEITSSIDE